MRSGPVFDDFSMTCIIYRYKSGHKFMHSDGWGPPQNRADDMYGYLAQLRGRDTTCETPLTRMNSTVSLYETAELYHSTVSLYDNTVQYHCTAS